MERGSRAPACQIDGQRSEEIVQRISYTKHCAFQILKMIPLIQLPEKMKPFGLSNQTGEDEDDDGDLR